MEKEILDIVIIIISFAAILIAILSYRQNSKFNKRQLRIEKLEEILEIIHVLYANYQYFEDTFMFKQDVLKEDVEKKVKDRYIEQVKELIEITNEIKLRSKLARLFVLNNSYLPKSKLKDKIGVFITVYTSIAESTITQSNKLHYLSFKKFPKSWEFLDFSQEIQNDFEKVFKNRYNLN